MLILCLRGESAPAEMDGRKPDDTRRVSGTVRDAAGCPLQGVQLQVCPHGGRAVISDREGMFEIVWRHSDWVQADYLVAQHAEKNLAVALPVDEETDGLNLALQPAVLLAGKVVDPDGQAIGEADVRVDLHASNWGSRLERSSAQTNAAGRFEVRAVPPDNRYSITATADGYGRTRTQLDASTTAGNHVDVGVLTLPVANLSVTGRVVDIDGRPMAGVRVYSASEAQPRVNVQTDTAGHFTLDQVCAGEIRIFAEVRINGEDVAGSVVTEGGASEITIVISEGRSVTRYIRTKTYDQIIQGGKFLAGVAVDESGSPVADVPVGVRCIRRKDAKGKSSWTFSSYTRLGDVTDERGRFIIELKEEAGYCLRFSPRHHAAVIAYDVPAGTRDVKATLPKGGTITGRLVRMEKGQKVPIPNAEVKAEQTDRTSYTHLGFERDRTTVTDAEGRFRFEHLRTKMRPISSMSARKWEYIQRVWKVVYAETAETVVFDDDTRARNLELVVRPDPSDAVGLIGSAIPGFDGIEIDLAPDQAQGKSLLICFFDMNQRPSRHCVRTLSGQVSALAKRGVLVVAIHAATGNADSLDAWAKKYDITVPVGTVAADVQEVKYTWAVQSLPWLILTDREHVVRAAGFPLSQLDRTLEQAGLQKKR